MTSTDGSAEGWRSRFVEAACGWGWDRPSTASAAAAEALLADAAGAAPGDFLVACLAGEGEAVARLLETDPGLATRPVGPRGWQPLLYVAYDVLAGPGQPRAAGVVAVARRLLAGGADPNACYPCRDDPGVSFPALYASIALTDNLDLARVLLEAGANPNDGQSPYHAAERFDGNQALDLLFAHGMNDKEISYCLFHKIDFTHEPGIRWFLDHGADLGGRHPKENETPLHWAIKRACPASVIDLLLERGADPSARTRTGRTAYPAILGSTPLDLSLRLGRLDVVDSLRRRGADSTPPTPADELMHACARGDGDVARHLLAADPALIHGRGPEDRALIAHLAQQDNAAAVRLMLALGFDPDAGGWSGSTALHWAACRGNAALVRDMLAHGVKLIDLGGDAGTPLHQALYHRWNPGGDYPGVLRAFVAAGVKLPQDLPPSGDAALDQLVAALRVAPPTPA
jgi:ankyrin repeat protein